MKLQHLMICWILCVLLVLLPGLSGRQVVAEQEDATREAVAAVLRKQQDAWNRGDVAAFMEGYWESPELTFAESNGITRGWQPVKERYLKNYPEQKAMGHLDFSDLEVHPLGKDVALVIGRWHLKRDSGEMGGICTLVFREFPEGWRIIHDHTSRSEKAP
jgi:ketosteroid isomerase-like protein